MDMPKAFKELAALRDAALEGIEVASDADVLKEAAEDGVDIKDRAAKIRASMQGAVAATLRSRMEVAKVRMQAKTSERSRITVRRPLEEIKRLVKDCFETHKQDKLGLAFREGDTQTDEDWVSLYEDLVRMGKLHPRDDEREL